MKRYGPAEGHSSGATRFATQPETTSLICSNGSGGNVMDTAGNVAVRHHMVWARMCAPTGIKGGCVTRADIDFCYLPG